MLYRVAVLAALALFGGASAFQAPVSAVSRSAVARSSAPLLMADDVEDKVKGIIAEQLGVELDSVVPGVRRASAEPTTPHCDLDALYWLVTL